MELIPAIGRHLKLYSTWIAIFAGTFDILYLTLESVKGLMEPTTFAWVNAGLIAAIKIATLFKQNFPVTPEQKAELVHSAVSTEVKVGS